MKPGIWPIALRHLRSRHRFGVISFTTALSVFGLMIGVASLVLIAAFSEGFSAEVEKKLQNIDGHIRIENFSDGIGIEKSEFVRLDSLIRCIDGVRSVIPVLRGYGLIQKGKQSEGLMLVGVPDSALFKEFHLDEIAQAKNNKKGVFLGSSVAKTLGLESGSKLTLFDLQRLVEDRQIFAKKFQVASIISTGFQEYDKLIAYCNLDIAQSFFEKSAYCSEVLVNLHDPFLASRIDEAIIEKIGSFPYFTTTYLERHSALFEFLRVFNIPILTVMAFITLLAIFNIASTLWMTITEKTEEIAALRTLGFRMQQLKRIFILEGQIVAVIGTIAGLTLAGLLLLLQDSFQLIRLSSEVYFMDTLPFQINYAWVALVSASVIVLCYVFSHIPVSKIESIQIVDAIHQD